MDPDPQSSIAFEVVHWPGFEEMSGLLRAAAASAFVRLGITSEMTVRLDRDDAVRALNRQFRGQDKPTNVLSFPAPEAPEGTDDAGYLGDLILAYETVAREAADQAKPIAHHAAHLLIHGILHLSGYDHDTPEAADRMETLERELLAGLEIPDPYLITDPME